MLKSEKDVALGVSKLTKIIVYFRDANVTKKKILISSMVTLWSRKKIKNKLAEYLNTRNYGQEVSFHIERPTTLTHISGILSTKVYELWNGELVSDLLNTLM